LEPLGVQSAKGDTSSPESGPLKHGAPISATADLVKKCCLVITGSVSSSHIKKKPKLEHQLQPEDTPLAAITQVREEGDPVGDVMMTSLCRCVGVQMNTAAIGLWWALIVD
jgi:hypothetical protein